MAAKIDRYRILQRASADSPQRPWTTAAMAGIKGYGGPGDDTLVGTDGDDVLNGAGGVDRMIGGLGNDTYYVNVGVEDVLGDTPAGDQVVEDADAGIDRVFASANYILAANVENLTLVGSGDIDGAGNALDNVITGNAGKNKIFGGDGNDIIDGGAGADFMIGGSGDDTFYVDDAGDRVAEGGEGNDVVYASVSFAVGRSAIETVRLTGTANIDATGNSQANTLVGNGGDNVLDGMDGPDRMFGGAGDDTYYVDDAGDKVVEANGEGSDVVYASVSFSLAGQFVETLRLSNANIDGIGNSQANTLVGGSGYNVLNGMGGADRMFGGAGNDTYYVDNAGDKVIEANGEGSDKVFSSVSFSLAGQFVELLVLTGTHDIDGTGNSQANRFLGNVGNNVFTGAGGADTFEFATGFGHDTITDFGPGTATGHDTIGFASGIFASYADMLSHATQAGKDVLISAASGDTLTLRNVSLGALASADFTFG